MEKIIQILMKRDGISKSEAIELAIACKIEILDALAAGCSDDAEDIIADYLGLEPDYIFDLLD